MNPKDTIAIDFPLKGEWQFLRPPGHHPFAFDFVKKDQYRKRYSRTNGIRYILASIPANSYYCWNQPVYSPIKGQVIRVGNGWPDHYKTNIWNTIAIWYNATYKFKPKEVNGKLDIRPNAGNYVMIKEANGYIVFLAHLKESSIVVEEGQFINSNDHVGNVGNSGNSTAPHLHINLFDQMDDPWNAKVLPFVFKRYNELGKNNKWNKYFLNVPKVKSFIKL